MHIPKALSGASDPGIAIGACGSFWCFWSSRLRWRCSVFWVFSSAWGSKLLAGRKGLREPHASVDADHIPKDTGVAQGVLLHHGLYEVHAQQLWQSHQYLGGSQWSQASCGIGGSWWWRPYPRKSVSAYTMQLEFVKRSKVLHLHVHYELLQKVECIHQPWWFCFPS